MRVVVDANVHVSALIGTGPPARIIEVWQSQRIFDVVMCPELANEIRRVCARTHLRRRIPEADVSIYLLTLGTHAIQMPDPESIEEATRDRSDDYLVALARTANADLIVSGDRDLTEWAEQQPPVVTPAEFEAMLASEDR
ncbi:MAG: putative toxin-antitoxin system toxin component, PIN family [Acidimicrobiaceae bacterium]|nr:putative toxin-antitoxin system toxin component, PIN family [Acidimicrobiaceae bacterium]